MGSRRLYAFRACGLPRYPRAYFPGHRCLTSLMTPPAGGAIITPTPKVFNVLDRHLPGPIDEDDPGARLLPEP
jgi:hypothetical protein